MARVLLEAPRVIREGTPPAPWTPGNPGGVGGSDGGMYLADNQGQTYIEVWRNDPNPGSVGVQFATEKVDGVSLPDKSFIVPAGGTMLAGPYPTEFYSQLDLTVYINVPTGNTLFRAYTVSDS